MTTRLVIGNSLIILIFMICSSFYCGESFIGGECVKRVDNRMFIVLLSTNIIGGIFYYIKTKKNILLSLILNIIITSVLYVVMATIHSISKAGLF